MKKEVKKEKLKKLINKKIIKNLKLTYSCFIDRSV